MDTGGISRYVRFGAFELDLRAGRLSKNGIRIRIPEQSFQVLVMLLDRVGDLVTREELHQQLWPNGTIVEFEHGINSAVKRLRRALGDSADAPRFIETLPRKGYRFLLSVERVQRTSAEGNPAEPLTVSHYRIIEKLAHGGMGVVYKAEDINLGRPAALKFLPDEMAEDEQMLERFRREARSASALNHPNICTIYEIGDDGGRPFIAMELLQGQNLSEVLAAGPMEVERLLVIALQAAAALEAAHNARIIHRDVKPANIFITHAEHVKLLDFGIAKSANVSACEAPAAGQSRLGLTRPSTPVGTPAYMSPEQVRGEELDPRTDIYSFGMVLYEMATGQQAFTRATTIAIRDAISNHMTPSHADPSSELPVRLGEIISRALEQDRELRYQSASDMQAELKRLKGDTDSRRDRMREGTVLPTHAPDTSQPQSHESVTVAVHQPEKKPEPPSKRRWWPLALAGAVCVVLLVTALSWLAARRTATVPVELRQRKLTANPTDAPLWAVAISPDGKYIAYCDRSGIHVKLIETGETRTIPPPLELPKNALWCPMAWFPDGTKLLAGGFETGHQSTWIVSVLTGSARMLRDNAAPGNVSPVDSSIAFVPSVGSLWMPRELWVMGANGEEPHKIVTDADSGIGSPVWSPNGQRLAYIRFHQAPDKLEASIESRDLKGGEPIVILSDPNLVGPCCEQFSWLADGRIIYTRREAPPNENDNNFWEIHVDGTGKAKSKPRRITNWSGSAQRNLRITADGKRLVFLKRRSYSNIHVAELEANGTHIREPRRLTHSEDNHLTTTWTPDSRTVLFSSDRNGRWEIFKQTLDEQSAAPIVADPKNHLWSPRMSPDGSWILYVAIPEIEAGIGTSIPFKLMRAPLLGGAPQVVLKTSSYSDHLCARDPANLCVLVEQSPDRKQLFFTSFDAVVGRGHELTRIDTDPDASYSLALSPDGLRLAIVKNGEHQGPVHVWSLADRTMHDISVKEWGPFNSVNWTLDGRGLFVSTESSKGPTLLHIDLEGNAHVLWVQEGHTGTSGVPSPNGRKLAISDEVEDMNAWMIENF